MYNIKCKEQKEVGTMKIEKRIQVKGKTRKVVYRSFDRYGVCHTMKEFKTLKSAYEYAYDRAAFDEDYYIDVWELRNYDGTKDVFVDLKFTSEE
jgi:hypothetical protein